MLNKRPKYELPDEVIVSEYRKHYKTPNFIPDISIGNFGVGCTGKIYLPKSVSKEIWVKSSNDKLLQFIKNYDFTLKNSGTATSNRGLKLMDFKKIILEEFYNKQEGCDIDEEDYR